MEGLLCMVIITSVRGHGGCWTLLNSFMLLFSASNPVYNFRSPDRITSQLLPLATQELSQPTTISPNLPSFFAQWSCSCHVLHLSKCSDSHSQLLLRLS